MYYGTARGLIENLNYCILVLTNSYQAIAADQHAACHIHQMVCVYSERFACTADEKCSGRILIHMHERRTYNRFSVAGHKVLCVVPPLPSSLCFVGYNNCSGLPSDIPLSLFLMIPQHNMCGVFCNV